MAEPRRKGIAYSAVVSQDSDECVDSKASKGSAMLI